MLSNDCPVQIVSIKIETQNIFTYFHLILNIVLLVILNPQFQSESRLKIKNLFYLQKIQMSLSLFCPQKSIIFLIMLSLASNINGQSFCSSACASRVDACYGISENECYACSASIFELNSNNGTCMPKNQHSVQFYELKNSAMDISTYSTNKPGVQSCSIYQMSGQYVSGDYIQKTFTGIPLNHYQLVIRFGVGHIGTWNPTDTMEIQIDGHTYSWQYNVCPEAQSLCSGSGADCFKIKQYVVTHDSPNVTLKFSSQITETNPLNQYWGIKDLVIGIRSCHARCATCFGANYADCSSCEAGYYLLGNLCVPSCQFLTIEDKRLCALQCPAGYFNNGNKLCKACQKDCLMCTGSGQGFCQVWNENKSGLIWEQNKPFWIFLIVVGFLIFLFLLWRMVLRKYFKPPIEDQGDMQKHMITENKIKDPKSSSSSEEKEKQRERDRDKSKSSLKTSKILFEEQGLTWVQQLESAPNVAVSKQGQLKKRKKNRVKPLVIQEQTGSCSQPSLYELEATTENLKL